MRLAISIIAGLLPLSAFGLGTYAPAWTGIIALLVALAAAGALLGARIYRALGDE